MATWAVQPIYMVYVDGDGKSLLMCKEDKQTFPLIETPAIPPPVMPATPQLVDQISNNRCVYLVELTHGLFSIIPFYMYFFACYVEFYHPYLQWWIAENLFNRKNFAQHKKGAIPVEVPVLWCCWCKVSYVHYCVSPLGIASQHYDRVSSHCFWKCCRYSGHRFCIVICM